MALAAGARLGPYEILSALGAGGMGEVYRARDTKLNRDIALKILPDSVANDPDRVARFTREAQVLASLNHPHIGAIHGLDEADGTRFLVLEFVDGGTLADRILRGRLPVDEALAVALQVADALEAAHERGVVHRDLKPANIMLTADGRVKVLDFGLAKFGAGGGGEAGGAAQDSTQSPTLTSVNTQAGIVLGTAAYMPPEQARGRATDKRSDVWAFGCVLYEMLAGRRAFAGEDATDTLAFVLTKEPDWAALPPSLPPPIRKLLRRCLVKDRKRRLPDIGVARLDIDEALTAPDSAAGMAIADDAWSAVAPPRSRPLGWLAATAGLGLVVGAVAVFAMWGQWRASSPATALRLSAELGGDTSLLIGQGPAAGASATLSPDGSLLAYVGQKGGAKPQIYIRRLDQLQVRPLSGTDGAGSPFFSPDGQWIAFFADNKLRKVSVAGGAAITLAEAPNPRGGSWAEDGTIAFVPDNRAVGLLRLSASGGKPETLTTLVEGEVTQRWPQVLAGGKAVLYTSHTNETGFDDASVVVQTLPQGPRTIVQRGAYYGRYLPSGHVIYLHDSTLFAVPFDLDRLEVTGQAERLLEGVAANPVSGGAQFAASNTGALLYLPGQSVGLDVPIQWMTRDGKSTPLRAAPANWRDFAFAPNGRLLAMSIDDGKQSDVFVYDWARDTLSRLTFDVSDDMLPAWTQDARRLAFASRRGDKSTLNLWWQRADGTGEAQRLTESRNQQIPFSWHPNGRLLAFMEANPQTQNDIMILPLQGDESSGWKPGNPTVFLNSPGVETQPAFSPDGRWLAYMAVEAGRAEVFVRPFPDPGGKWQISSGGGVQPTWSRSRHELFFSTTPPDNRIMVASYAVEGDSFRPDEPRLWSEPRYINRAGSVGAARGFDLHPDGVRVALAKAPNPDTAAKQDKMVFIFNVFDELRRIAPAAKR
jgi:Tol biopolymer transport system component